MSADWDEVKRLAADFQRAQLSSTALRLSERNCIEIVRKLIDSKLIEVIFTTDGSEYLTPARLLKEIRDELTVHGGRINLVDLAHIIGVDYNHVEVKAAEFLNNNPNTYMVLGQLITTEYLDFVAEEINEKLQQVGEISIAQITTQYDLPGDFLEDILHSRLGTIIQGQVDSNDSRTFFTESYVAQHTARIRGALSALTRPVPLPSVISHFKFPEKLFYYVAENLVKEKRLSGTLTGGRSERAIFIPDIYAKSQNEWVDSFYKQNGYLEYDAVRRLGILDPKSYIKKKYKDEPLTYLSSCCVGIGILTQIEVTIEEALNTGTWVDVLPVLPSIFTPEDCEEVIPAVTKSIAKQGTIIHVYCDTLVVSDSFLKNAEATFDSLMAKKAEEDIKKNPNLFTTTQASKSATSKKETMSKVKLDRKDEKKKRASTGGKAGGGTQGRETKTKNVKKKYFTEKDADDFEIEEDDAPMSKHSRVDLEFMNADSIRKHINQLPAFKDCPEELVCEISAEIHRPLTRKYQDVVKTMFESSAASSGATRRKLHVEYQEKFTTLHEHVHLFEKAAKLFSDDVSSQLSKHLLKTLCADLVNMAVIYIAREHGLASPSDADSSLTNEARQKIVSKFPEDIRSPLMKLHNSLNSKTMEDFNAEMEAVLDTGICDVAMKKTDKKKERLALLNHRHNLLQQLQEAEEAALCLHLAVLMIFQSHTNSMLHASGKFVPHIVSYLQRQVPVEVYQLLSAYQECVMKKLSSNENEEEQQKNEAMLIEMMPKIKEMASTYKKTSVSESGN